MQDSFSDSLQPRERRSYGKSLRASHPRTSLAEHTRGNFSVVEEIKRQEEARIPALLELRHARMSASPFAFYRGTAVLMARDLESGPSSPLYGQVCGDAHVSNFGLFAAPDRGVVFDVNDFDETHSPAPLEWDVKRLAVSCAIVAREQGADVNQYMGVAESVARAWQSEVSRLAQMRAQDVWYLRSSEDQIMAWAEQRGPGTKKALSLIENGIARAKNRDGWSAVRKLTVERNGTRRFRDLPPLLTPMPEQGAELVEDMYTEYVLTCPDDLQQLLAKYRIVDVAHKVVGVGSVGLFAIVALLQGSTQDDLLVLQAKQAQASVIRSGGAIPGEHEGRRVVLGQRRLQATGDIFLGWTTGPGGRHYYVRQLRDMKWSPDLAALPAKLLPAYGHACAVALARGHCRTADPAVLTGYLGTSATFVKAIGAYAGAYVAQAYQDYDDFLEAVAEGEIAIGDGEDMRAWWAQLLAAQTR